jgi:uncharacterized C2H2 Zn-finger protein
VKDVKVIEKRIHELIFRDRNGNIVLRVPREEDVDKQIKQLVKEKKIKLDKSFEV